MAVEELFHVRKHAGECTFFRISKKYCRKACLRNRIKRAIRSIPKQTGCIVYLKTNCNGIIRDLSSADIRNAFLLEINNLHKRLHEKYIET